MFYLETPRLILVATPLEVVRMRLGRDTFSAEVPLPGGALTVSFPAEWPGDSLVIFPRLAKQLEKNPEQEFWDGTLVERATRTAVGQLGCKDLPDENGSVEIGYSLNPEVRGRGYATEIVGALTAWLLNQPTVSLVTAECLETNRTSPQSACSGKPGLSLWVRKLTIKVRYSYGRGELKLLYSTSC